MFGVWGLRFSVLFFFVFGGFAFFCFLGFFGLSVWVWA